MENYNHFVAIIAGENPEEIMEKYNSSKEVEPYVVYKYEDAEKLKKYHISFLTEMLKNKDLSDVERIDIENNLNTIKEETTDEFYCDLISDYTCDEKTGDAISTENPNGKFKYYAMGKYFSLPFILKDGSEKFQARKKDIAWDKIHLNGQSIYATAWDMVMEGKEPENDYERDIYNNMKNRKSYFEFFGSRDKYVISSTAFWGYAFSNGNEWHSMDDDEADQTEWMSNFYEKFIDCLDDNTLLTIYECRKD